MVFVRKTGDNLLDLLATQPEHQLEVKTAWGRALSGEQFTAIQQFGNPARDRRSYEIRFNTLRDRDGNRIGAYQFVYDVTDRLRDQDRLRNAEAALRQTQKMESLGQLTGGIAHDFNNLLAVFGSGLQLLELTAGQPPNPRVFEAMHRAIARGTGLTRHLLAFSRRRPINPESIDVAAHLKGMRSMLDGSLGGHIQVQMHIADDIWPVVVDAGEMELAILESVPECARRHARRGSHLGSASKTCRAKARTARRRISCEISIADTGQGMSSEVQARAFEPFFTTKDVGKGSGLGLPQVYGFAQQSAWSSHDSQRRWGPAQPLRSCCRARCATRWPHQSRGSRSEPATSSIPRRRGHALLVEDDKEVSELTSELLRSLGFTVTHVASADAALERARGTRAKSTSCCPTS